MYHWTKTRVFLWVPKYTRVTPKKRRWFVLKDFFLFYYESKSDPKPAGVIVLEYFTVKIEEESNVKYLHLKRNFEEFANSVLAYNIPFTTPPKWLTLF